MARVLANDYEVQVAGPQFGPSVWPPMAGLLEQHGIGVVAESASRYYPQYLTTSRRLLQRIDADLIYALKPFPTSFGLGLTIQHHAHVPLMLDIDDWELGAYQALRRKELWRSIIFNLRSPNNYLGLRQLYQQTQRADAITVSSRFLKQKFGGVIVPHGRDTTDMDPTRHDREEVRRQWNLAGKTVMFLGTIRPHKGVEDLLTAMQQLGQLNAQCMIVGADERDPYIMSLKELAIERVRFLPMLPFEQIPALLLAADVVVIPQRQTRFSEGQVPAKIFDAMAMARPIISTAVSDIPDILQGCGIIVPPDNASALADALKAVLNDEALAAQLGQAARVKCVRDYSWGAMRPILRDAIEQVMAKQ